MLLILNAGLTLGTLALVLNISWAGIPDNRSEIHVKAVRSFGSTHKQEDSFGQIKRPHDDSAFARFVSRSSSPLQKRQIIIKPMNPLVNQAPVPVGGVEEGIPLAMSASDTAKQASQPSKSPATVAQSPLPAASAPTTAGQISKSADFSATTTTEVSQLDGQSVATSKASPSPAIQSIAPIEQLSSGFATKQEASQSNAFTVTSEQMCEEQRGQNLLPKLVQRLIDARANGTEFSESGRDHVAGCIQFDATKTGSKPGLCAYFDESDRPIKFALFAVINRLHILATRAKLRADPCGKINASKEGNVGFGNIVVDSFPDAPCDGLCIEKVQREKRSSSVIDGIHLVDSPRCTRHPGALLDLIGIVRQAKQTQATITPVIDNHRIGCVNFPGVGDGICAYLKNTRLQEPIHLQRVIDRLQMLLDAGAETCGSFLLESENEEQGLIKVTWDDHIADACTGYCPPKALNARIAEISNTGHMRFKRLATDAYRNCSGHTEGLQQLITQLATAGNASKVFGGPDGVYYIGCTRFPGEQAGLCVRYDTSLANTKGLTFTMNDVVDRLRRFDDGNLLDEGDDIGHNNHVCGSILLRNKDPDSGYLVLDATECPNCDGPCPVRTGNESITCPVEGAMTIDTGPTLFERGLHPRGANCAKGHGHDNALQDLIDQLSNTDVHYPEIYTPNPKGATLFTIGCIQFVNEGAGLCVQYLTESAGREFTLQYVIDRLKVLRASGMQICGSIDFDEQDKKLGKFYSQWAPCVDCHGPCEKPGQACGETCLGCDTYGY